MVRAGLWLAALAWATLAQVSPNALAPTVSGSITHAGRTTTPTTSTFGAVSLGSTATQNVVVKDPVSGPAQMNDACWVVLANGALPPTGMAYPTCQISAVGQATVLFQAIALINAGTLTYYVQWRG